MGGQQGDCGLRFIPAVLDYSTMQALNYLLRLSLQLVGSSRQFAASLWWVEPCIPTSCCGRPGDSVPCLPTPGQHI